MENVTGKEAKTPEKTPEDAPEEAPVSSDTPEEKGKEAPLENKAKGKKEKKKDKKKKDKGAPKDKASKGSSKISRDEKKIKFGLRMKFYMIIIPIVSLTIGVMAVYFIIEESNLLKKEIIKFAEREIEHLNNTARLSILPGGDILPLLDALRDIRKITSIRYAYILDKKNKVIQHFSADNKGLTQEKGKVLNDDITKQAINYKDTTKPLLVQFDDPADSSGKIYDFSMPIMHPLYQKIRTGTVRLGFSDRIIREEIDKITRTIGLVTVFFLIIAIIGAILSSRMIIRPIEILSKGASIIGTGDLDYKIELNRSDELGRLANEFNVMTEEIKKAKDLEISTRLMEEQLELAKEIQEGLNPMKYYDNRGIQIKGHTEAAKGVGGDYFDYIEIDDSRVGALISDVSGKGVPASLVMVMIRTVFVTFASRGDVDCASVVTAINDSLSADFAIDKFATLFFMIFNHNTGELAFSNAGHGPLFCFRAAMGGVTITKLDGMPIGVMEDVEYHQGKVRLNKGDIICLYTDGITEMRNRNKEEYGLNRLQKFIINNSNLNANDLVEKIVSDVTEFRGEVPPHDDTTILVLKRD